MAKIAIFDQHLALGEMNDAVSTVVNNFDRTIRYDTIR